jgi:hypothetical protein
MAGKAFSTRTAYECYLDNGVLPYWGDYRLDQIKPDAGEEWVAGIKRARGAKAEIPNLMSVLFHHAVRNCCIRGMVIQVDERYR